MSTQTSVLKHQIPVFVKCFYKDCDVPFPGLHFVTLCVSGGIMFLSDEILSYYASIMLQFFLSSNKT